MRSIPQYESNVVEFKSQWGDKDDGQTIKKTLVAFANTFGGDLYIGINDDGSVCGLEDIHAVEERLYTVVRDTIYPSIAGFVTAARLTVAGKTVLHVHVERGAHPPYSLTQDDPRHVFVRVGCTSVPARIEDIAEMVERSNPVPFEERIARDQNLTFEACLAFCRERGVLFHPETNTNFGFWDPKRKGWTNLAALCSDQGTAKFNLITFRDDDKTEIADAKKISGSLFALLEQALEFVARSNYAGMEKPTDGSLERVDHYRVNPDAVREAIINQLVHRDYSKDVPSYIHITPNRIDFWSSGGLHNLSPRDIIENLSTSCRNVKLAAFLTMLRLMEGLGTGFRLIRKNYRGIPLERLVTITDSSVSISLPRAQLLKMETLNERQRTVIKHVRSAGSVTRKTLENLLQLSQPMCAVILRDLVQKGWLVKQGAGPRVCYVLAPTIESGLAQNNRQEAG